MLSRDRPPNVYTVLSESAVRGVQGDERVMIRQLEHLITLSRRPNIILQLVPFKAAAGPRVISRKGILERFALLRLASPGVIGELPRHLDYAFTTIGDELQWSDDVRHYEELWNRASSAALSPHETRAFLWRVLEDFR